MDKTLEIVLVATVLVVAAVIVVGLLQGQAGSFGGFAENQTTSASCGISKSQYCNAIESGNTDRAEDIHSENGQCSWSDGSSSYSASDC